MEEDCGKRTGLSSWKKTSAALAQIKEQIRLNGGSDIKEEDSEPATSAKDIKRSARLCERQAKNLPKAKLTGREKQKAKYSDRSLVQSLGQTVRV